MPLHLLGKKSWNPYSPAAIARVQADEAAYAALEQDYAERLASYESQRSLAQLRGTPFDVRPPTPPPARIDARPHHGSAREQRQAKASSARRHGEDDTERDMRLARASAAERAQPAAAPRPPRDAPVRLTDAAGHIQLVEQPRAAAPPDRQQRVQQRAQEQAEGGMRLKHAAGYTTDISAAPWYSAGGAEVERAGDEAPAGRDAAWQQREERRVASADPMADMQRGIGRMKAVRAERERLNREREADLLELREEQERRARREERLRAAHRSSHGHSRRRRSRSASPRRPRDRHRDRRDDERYERDRNDSHGYSHRSRHDSDSHSRDTRDSHKRHSYT